MHPSDFYIRYTLARGWAEGREDHDSISNMLSSFELLPISSEELTQIQASFKPPAPFLFQNRKHGPTSEFMREQQLYALWNPEGDEKKVLSLLDKNSARECIQTLLMGRLPSSEIAKRVNWKFKLELSAKIIETYAHFFWNVEGAGLAEWSKMLYGHPLKDHYLASLIGSPNQALFRAGFSPHINGKSALRELHRSLALRIEASRRMPDTRETASTLGLLAKSFLEVHTALYGDGAGMEEQLKELAKFKMEKDKATVIPLRKLAKGGSFSGSGNTSAAPKKGDDDDK